MGRRKGEAEDAPAADSLERRWEMSSQGANAETLVGAIYELVQEAPVVVSTTSQVITAEADFLMSDRRSSLKCVRASCLEEEEEEEKGVS